MSKGDQEIRFHVQVLKGPDNLECSADAEPADLVRLQPENGLTLKGNLTGCGLQNPGDEVKKGGLACPVRTDDAHDLLSLSTEAHAFDSAEAVEFLSQFSHLKKSHGLFLPVHRWSSQEIYEIDPGLSPLAGSASPL
jgi:hypothetical protein